MVSNTASGNTIGGTTAGLGNRIAFQAGAGCAWIGHGQQHPLQQHLLQRPLGIDLVAPGDPPSGVTPNQPGIRIGPNNLQNYPVLTR